MFVYLESHILINSISNKFQQFLTKV